MSALGADVSRVQAASDADICGAFDNRPAVGKDRHFVWIREEPQGKFVCAYVAERLQLRRNFGRSRGRDSFMNLHRIPAAQADRRPFATPRDT